MTFMMPLMMLIMNLVSVGIVWFGGHAIDAGALQTGDLIAFITYSMVIIMGFLMIGMLSIMLPRADVAAQRIEEVLECEPSICDPAPADSKDAELSASCVPGAEVAFHDVCFRYSDSAENVLDHVDFTCKPGKTTAIIGSTGSGKSTIVKLVPVLRRQPGKRHHRRRRRSRRDQHALGNSARSQRRFYSAARFRAILPTG